MELKFAQNSVHIPEPKLPQVCSILRAWTIDVAAIVRSKILTRIKEDFMSVSMLFLFSSPLLCQRYIYMKNHWALWRVMILQSINNNCLGGTWIRSTRIRFLLQRLYHEFIMTLLSLPGFECTNKFHKTLFYN